MRDERELMEENLFHAMVRFSVPYLISTFLQTLYGMADLFFVGQFESAAAVTAVSVGSQVMHMLTVIIVGLAMGTTVSISYAMGAGEKKKASRYLGNSVTIFAIFAAALTVILLFCISGILSILQVPSESFDSAHDYLFICFLGIPFITFYNVIASIFRGLGDTTHPMIFVAIAGAINIGLDWLFIGPMHMGAAGAALATVLSQAGSVLMAYVAIRKQKDLLPPLERADFALKGDISGHILSIGVPVALQDGLIQVSFLVITAIADSRGVDIAAAVGIVEKIISFLFLVPSAMLSTISALASCNIGAGKPDRAKKCLVYGIRICVIYGACVCLLSQFAGRAALSLFVPGEEAVITYGDQYLRTYSLDCIFAGVQFCFSGYFCARGKSLYAFLHNVISIALVRIPVAYLASVYFPDNLSPMGLAAPMGSLLSIFICLFLYHHLEHGRQRRAPERRDSSHR